MSILQLKSSIDQLLTSIHMFHKDYYLVRVSETKHDESELRRKKLREHNSKLFLLKWNGAED